jgi:dCTP deaminase
VILTAAEIVKEIEAGDIVVQPFHVGQVEPNSYGFRLGHNFVTYCDSVLDPRRSPRTETVCADDLGRFILEPGKFYLGHTLEYMGSRVYASTLYARRSVATLGVWIQVSAPLGHTGEARQWTLEMRAIKPTILYAGSLIGKIAFWRTSGEVMQYDGLYTGTAGPHPSAYWRNVADPHD